MSHVPYSLDSGPGADAGRGSWLRRAPADALTVLQVALTVLYVALTVLCVALTVLYVALIVLYVALTVLHVALTVLFVALTVLCVALTVLHVPSYLPGTSEAEFGVVVVEQARAMSSMWP